MCIQFSLKDIMLTSFSRSTCIEYVSIACKLCCVSSSCVAPVFFSDLCSSCLSVINLLHSLACCSSAPQLTGVGRVGLGSQGVQTLQSSANCEPSLLNRVVLNTGSHDPSQQHQSYVYTSTVCLSPSHFGPLPLGDVTQQAQL